MHRRQFLLQSAAAGVYRVSPDGSRLQTKDLQAAIDTCAKSGGGTVYFPPGRYLSGTLFLRSNVTLHLDAGATLLGSSNLADYPPTVCAFRSYTDNYTDKSLLYAENVESIGLEGKGTIDGQGASFKGPYRVRPYMIRVIGCRNVRVSGLSIKDSPMWVQHYLGCEGVHIQGITVRSRVNANNDGMDIDCSDRVRISDCDIWSGDDAIVLKSTADRPCRHVTISNCVLSSACNALKLGTETNGGFENILIDNCAIYDTRLSGVALELVDGGTLERVTVSNLNMTRVGAPIFVRLGDRARPFREGGPRPPVGKLRQVILTNIQAAGASPVGCAVSGIPGHAIEDLTLENIRLMFEGGGQPAHPHGQVPEHPEKYPEHHMFGALPAYGFYFRHVRDLRLRNVQLRTSQPDPRPAMLCDDVEGLQGGI
jgi:polygalacturonase